MFACIVEDSTIDNQNPYQQQQPQQGRRSSISGSGSGNGNGNGNGNNWPLADQSSAVSGRGGGSSSSRHGGSRDNRNSNINNTSNSSSGGNITNCSADSSKYDDMCIENKELKKRLKRMSLLVQEMEAQSSADRAAREQQAKDSEARATAALMEKNTAHMIELTQVSTLALYMPPLYDYAPQVLNIVGFYCSAAL